jgi:uncharacterized protein (TIGR02596 family)
MKPCTLSHPKHKPQRRDLPPAAFTLMELLVAVGIIALLAVMAIPAFNHLLRAGQLAGGGRMLIDEIAFARQTALSRNLPVEVRIYKLPPHNRVTGGASTWRGFQAVEIGAGGEKPLGNPKYLPTGVIIAPDEDRSSMLTLGERTPAANLGEYSTANVRYVALRFSPSGTANLTNANNFLTLVTERDKPLSAGANFVTVQVNPVTGAVRSFRP